MTQEDKELLLKDLCARLPYGVIIKSISGDDYGRMIDVCWDYGVAYMGQKMGAWTDDYLPYLRPMSSMTEEEYQEYDKACDLDVDCSTNTLKTNLKSKSRVLISVWNHGVDWLNAHHFDYRGLIERGLALEAPDGMYNKEQPEKESEVPIPKTVDEAVKTLAKIVSEEDRDYLLENGAISVHDSLGRWIRNEWGLWTGSDLKNELKKKGFEHPDDMSNYVIEEFIKYCNNKL